MAFAGRCSIWWPRSHRRSRSYNWKWAGKDTWHYEHEVFNVGHGRFDANAFLDQPSKVIDERVTLW